MRDHFKRLCRAALLVLALQPVYLLALVATDYVAPPEVRRERLLSIPPIPGNDPDSCVSLAIGLEPGGGGLHNAIQEARPLSSGTACDALAAAAAKAPNVAWLPYPRYWHGYRVVLDPLTAWLPMYPVRYLMLAALIAALTWFSFELLILVGADTALALIVPTVVLTDLWVSWNYVADTIAQVLIFAGSAVAARAARRPHSNIILIAVVFGSLFNYVDNLVNPPWQPMLIAFIALAAGRRGKETLAIVVAWFAGYSLTWASKWAIAVAAGNSWRDIFEVILFRLNGDYPGYVKHHFLAPTTKVLTFIYHDTRAAMLFLLLLPTLLLPIRQPNPKRFAMLSSPILIPFVWYETLSNHTQIHTWFTYRTAASAFGVLIAAAIIASRKEPAGVDVAQQKSAG
jgi:hypothetical protein